jgi:hypothetical protein
MTEEDDLRAGHEGADGKETDPIPETQADEAGEEPPVRPMGILRAIAGLLVSAYILIVSLAKTDEVFRHSNEPDVAHNANNFLWTPLAVVGIPLGAVLIALYVRRVWQILHGNKLS